MNTYEKLLETAESNNITVLEKYDLSDTRIRGLYCDGTIALDKDIESNVEKGCILAEELGHYYTSSGNILNLTSATNRKQEYKARLWAYNEQIGLHGILSSYKAGCQNTHEMAEHLDVTEDFLLEALSCYQKKYGICTEVDNYVIYFEPALAVLELI